MPLPLPTLDNRTFDELVAEGRALLPRYAPTWTDHNFHDPGLTLLELFAWLVEQDIYRLDRTLPASYRAFLRLLGIELRPAQVAETVLAFSLDPSNEPAPLPTEPALLPAGVQISTADDTLVFQTTGPLQVSRARLGAVFGGTDQTWVERTAENQTTGQLYPPFGLQPEPGRALYLGFDRPLSGEPAEVSLYVWTGSIAADQVTRQQLIAEWQAAQDEATATCPPGVEPDLPGWWLHYSARTAWEYFSAGAEWLPLDGVTDETRGLTLSGPVRFTAPIDQSTGGPDGDHFFIRCRLLSGQYDCPPEIDGVALNAVLASHAADVEPERLLGLSHGRAGQRFQLDGLPVVPGSTGLRVVLNGVEDEAWHEVLFWDLVGPHERAYLLSPESGQITFGDGRVGRVPAAGAEIWARHQVGGGPAGNVAASRLSEALDGPHNANLVLDWPNLRPILRVAQPYAASGGAPAEALAQAQGRALAALAERRGAITLADFEALALATPGVPVARTRALADYHPAVPCFPALGCVMVVIVPACPAACPQPGPDLLRAVARYLERRRSLTTELHVIGPTYVPVIVHARLHAEPGLAARQVAAQAQSALDNFFHPLTGGPDGTGWPVGRDVYRAEVMALLNALPGVTYVDELGLQTEGDLEPRCGNLPVCPDDLIASGKHQIQVIPRGPTAHQMGKKIVDSRC